jgi:hypothetical protein
MPTEIVATDTETASQPSRPLIGDTEFFANLGYALLALAFSAVILVTAYGYFSADLDKPGAEATSQDIRPRTITGSDLIARMGHAEETRSEGLRITELEQGIDNRAIFTRKTSFRAEDYPFLEYNITNRHPGERFYFIWRAKVHPEQVHNSALHSAGDGATMALLAKSPECTGKIVEVGLDIYDDLRNQPPTVHALTLLPPSGVSLLRAIWVEWTAFRQWTQGSPNYLRGSTPGPILSPTLAIATWTGLAAFLLGLLNLAGRARSPLPYAMVILIPWISLDLLWQKNLSTQLDETRYLFAGKTQHEKHLADREQALYRYARHLKDHVLPSPGVKIFLLHDSALRGYRRLKAQHYLLPHNVFNFGKLPRENSLQKGDYLLVLDKVGELVYAAESGQLQWHNKAINVELVDQQEMGSLYLYKGKK